MKISRFNRLCIITMTSLIVYSCANQIALTGGPRDTEPPKLDSIVSTANYQLHYIKDEIELRFDEFINLQSPARQIIISPPLQFPLDIDHRGKRIRMNFDEEEVLKDDATYIINFGEAIADFTENNQLKKFSFVFSTGDFIDSLRLNGKVLDAKSKEPVENITVMLYDNIYDSVVYKERPFYFAKTEEEGTFTLQNLRADTFKIVALEDLNLNYLYEDNAEQFAFLLENIELNDSSEYDLTLLSFKLKSDPRYLDNNVPHDGHITFTFDQDLAHNPVVPLDESLTYYSETDAKNVLFWIEESANYPYSFAIRMDTIWDTISIRRPQSKDRKDLPVLRITESNVSSESGLHPTDTLRLTFNLPINSVVHNLVRMQDSIPLLSGQVVADTAASRILSIAYPWEQGGDYVLTLDSSSITDFYGRAIDSTAFPFSVGRKNGFGEIKLALRNAIDNINYVITLNDENSIIKVWNKISSADTKLLIEKLPPSEYSLRITEDRNNNGEWDPGDYLQKRYAENIFEVQLEPLKENWTLEATIDFSTLDLKE